MTEAILIKIGEDTSRFWFGVNNPKYWIATHLGWYSCKASSPVKTKDLIKYRWIPLSSKQLVWWEDE